MNAVFDASALVKLVLRETGSDEALDIWERSDRVSAPGLALAECANTLWKAFRRGDVDAAGALERLDRLRRFDIDYVEWESLLPTALLLGIDLGHDTYDCVYLAHAVAETRMLVTADRGLAKTATRAGAEVMILGG